ncbi:unnamed protein product [Paramecium primaurelia]|uniref:Uncharacterized protein n=1 Tax=Paramecium primaurelia TaxID=5886 RepID=A0A8S1LEE3_PARPR|nr:unnamed protein product [Paramecium primaurelia]
MKQTYNPNREYLSIYKQICQEQHVHLSKTITQGLKDQSLRLNAILIRIEDIIPLQLLLSLCHFDSIIVYGRLRKKMNKNDLVSLEELQQIINGILTAINLNLTQSQFNLMQIHITDLILSPKDCESISFGLKSTKTLKELKITNCSLTSQHLQILSEPIQQCVSLNLLDLSNNLLKENAGMIIGKIISSHAGRRDEMKWAEEIRGDEPPQQLALQGLCEIFLHQNMFDDRCVKDLCNFLMYDSWTKNIGLRENQIGEEGVKLFSQILDTNESLISLDLRENPGFVEPYSKDIFDKLVRNIKIFKEQKNYYEDVEENQQDEYPIIQEQQQEESEELECPNCKNLLKQNKQLQRRIQQLQQRPRYDSQLMNQEINKDDEQQSGDLLIQIENKMNELTTLMDMLEQSKQQQQYQQQSGNKSKKKKKKILKQTI